jgi:hypothetical protein
VRSESLSLIPGTPLILFIENEAEESAHKLIEQFRKENPGLEQYVSFSIDASVTSG